MLSIKKLLLVTSIAAASSSAFAMQAMDDQSLADTTGQDGITISINTPSLSMETIVHDGDGFTGSTNPGAIVLGSYSPISVNTGGGDIVATIDAGDAGTTTPVLNIGVSIPTGTIIHTGTISVADSNGMGVAVTNETAAILNDMTITLGATTMNIQLGNAPQGSMVDINTVMTGGLDIANFALNDSAGGSSISASDILTTDNGGANLTVHATASVTTAGLVVDVAQLGTGTGISQQITGLQFGTAPAIGNVEVIGLNLDNTTITIAGH